VIATYGNPIAALLDRILHPLNRLLEDRGFFEPMLSSCRLMNSGKAEKNYSRRGTVIPNHIVINPSLNVAKAQPPAVLWLSNIKPFKRPTFSSRWRKNAPILRPRSSWRPLPKSFHAPDDRRGAGEAAEIQVFGTA
jgi:hypothetical protein